MNWLNNLERKIGRYAIQHLIRYIIAAYVIGFGIQYFLPNLFSFLVLEPGLILQGQVWRIVSWILIPPGQFNIFTLIMLFLYFWIGSSLERTWGSFRFNVFIFSGILFSVVGAFFLYFVTGQSLLILHGVLFNTYYINMSMFLAFAVTFPNMELMLYFVLPVKMKWLGLVYAGLVGFGFVTGNAVTRVMIIASMLNFILFAFFTMRQGKFRTAFKSAPKPAPRTNKPSVQNIVKTTHKCSVCGRTEKDDPTLEFRYCSKCTGGKEYCQDHLFTHEHK